MSYLKDREIWLSNVPTGNPPTGYFWKFIQNGKVVVRDSSGNNQIMVATSGSQSITGSLTVTGQVVAQTLNVQQVTSSIVYSSGSNVFGNSLSNTQQFTGSVGVTGSLTVAGAGTFTGNVSLNASNLILGLGNNANNESIVLSYNNNAASRSWRIIKDWTAFGDFQIQQSTTQAGTTYADILRFSPTGVGNFSSSLRVQGSAVPTSGAGTELAWDGTNGYLLAYNRTTSAYLPLFIQGSSLSFTGAATFSSSVTAASGLYNGYTSGLPATSGSAARGGLRLNNASNISIDFGTVASGQAWIQVSDAGNYASNFPLLLNPNGGNVGIGVSSLVSPGGSRRLLQISNSTNGAQIALGSSTSESNNPRIFSGQFDLGFAAGVTTGNIDFYTNDQLRLTIASSGAATFNSSVTSFAASPLVASVASNPANDAVVAARWTSGLGMEMRYNPDSAVGFIQNTYPVEVNQLFGDIQFRHSIGGTMTSRMIIKGYSGNVGINTPSPTAKFHVFGTAKFDDANGITLASNTQFRQIYFDGFSNLYFWNGSNQSYLSSAGAWVNASDISIKKDIKEIKYNLSDLLKLKPKSYKMVDTDLEQIGFIAQDVENIISELVGTDNKGMKSLNYGNMNALIVKAIQEQQTLIESLKSRIEILEQ